jgi:hypothetical protein
MPKSRRLLDDLEDRLDLAVAAWRAQGEGQPSVAEGQRGGEGVIGAFARGDEVGVPFVQGEEGAPVLKDHARDGLQQAGSETAEEALDPTHGIAVGVHHREVYRVAPVVHLARGRGGRPDTGCDARRGHGWVDQSRSPGEVSGIQQLGHGHLGVFGVRHPPITVGEGQLLELDHRVEIT